MMNSDTKRELLVLAISVVAVTFAFAAFAELQ
jgi:hypothetical protein